MSKVNFARARGLRALCGLLILIASHRAAAGGGAADPLTAARISVAALQNVLASPPLPTLRTKEGRAILFQGGYSTGTLSVESGEDYAGMLEGATVGIGYTGRAERGFAFFGTLIANSLQGSLTLNQSQAGQEIRFDNMSVQAIAGLGGGSWRLLGDNASFAAFGVFGGPMFAKLTSSFDLEGPGFRDTFRSSPALGGAVAGAQIELRPGSFMVKPYVMFFQDMTDPCKDYEGPATSSSSECDSNKKRLPLKGSFAAFGVNLGYKGFKVNAMSQVFNDETLATFEVHNYQLSYTRGFD